MTLRKAFEWAVLLLAVQFFVWTPSGTFDRLYSGSLSILDGLLVVVPLLILFLTLRAPRPNDDRYGSLDLSEIGQGLIWCGVAAGVIVGVTMGSMYGYTKLFPPDPIVKNVYIDIGGAELPACLPIKVGSKIKAKGHWAVPNGTTGLISKTLGQSKTCNSAYVAAFEGAEGTWCAEKDTFEPIECSAGK